MEIVPLYGERPLALTDISVAINRADRERAEALVARTSAIKAIDSEETYNSARKAAGELKGLINEIQDSAKGAKRPFTGVTNAINDLAKEVGLPVVNEHERILELLNAYVARLEMAKKEAERLRRQEQLAYEAKIRAAQEAERQAKNEAAAAQARLDQLAQEMALEASAIAKDQEAPRRGLVPGGRVDHPWRFTLKDVLTVIQAGNLHLLRWELNILSCQDMVRAQLERNPDGIPDLPGIECVRETSVSVRPTARTRYS
jgi:multidrug efflux pump subunit AcrA (membrane-fusion protein)